MQSAHLLIASAIAHALLCVSTAHAQIALPQNQHSLQYATDAVSHRSTHYAKENYWCIYYLTTHAYPDPQQQSDLRHAVSFAVASASAQDVIEYCTPQPIGTNEYLSVIQLQLLLWDYKQFCKVLEKYPYKHYEGSSHPLVIRADWLMAQLLDPTKSDALYRLLYNNEKLTRDQFIKFWGGNTDVNQFYAIPELDSKVAANSGRKRWLLNVGNNRRTYLWHTLDFFVIDKDTDPLGHLLYPIQDRFVKAVHNGEELIAGMPKFSLRTHDSGALQAYLLANQNGQRIEEAPGTLVRGDGSFRQYTAITNQGGCLNCHKSGLIPSSGNDLIGYLAPDPKTGINATAIAKYKDQIRIDKATLRSAERDIKTDNSLYAAGVLMCNGLTPTQNILAVQRAIRAYDAPVTLEQAATEICCKPEELRLAMSWHNATVKYNPVDAISVNPRFADLAKGRAIPRSAWEDIYTYTVFTLRDWQIATKGKGP